jgi:phosphoserine/homoserine phosphotransferase
MKLVCLDLEGVLVPEIWINFAEATGIQELRRTTRDEPDYDKLMRFRIAILEEKKLTLHDIQKVIGKMGPLPGGREFLDKLRGLAQVIILSDTFEEFAKPLMEQLGWPTLFCNSLVSDTRNMITGFSLRQIDGKRKAVEAFKTTGCKIFAAGDSYNDISMLKAADKGALFHAPDSIKREFPELDSFERYDDLFHCIEGFVRS